MISPIPFNKNTKIQLAHKTNGIEFFNGEELQRIFDYVRAKIRDDRQHEAYHRRYYLLMKALLHTGARIEEIVPFHKDAYLDEKGRMHREISSPGLRPVDFDLDLNTVRIPTLKKHTTNGKLPERVLPLSAEMEDEYKSYLLFTKTDLKGKDPLFPITRVAVNLYMKKMQDHIGIKIHPHKFRHTFAVSCVLSNVPLSVLQQWMAHSSLVITSIYTQVTGMDTSRYVQQVNFGGI